MTESPLERLLDSGAPLPLAMLRAAIDSADLVDQALAERTIRGAWSRIVPPLDRDSADRFLVRFYLRSLHSAIADDVEENAEQLLAGLDAAISLRELLVAWVDAAHPPHSSIDYLVDQITRAFLAADTSTRCALKWFFLAPVLEHEAIVPLFEVWRGSDDSELATAFDEAYACSGDRARQEPRPHAAENHSALERYRDRARAIPLAELRGLMSSADLVDNAVAAELLTTGRAQIEPPPEVGEARPFLIDFLLRAMIENRPLPRVAGSADDLVPTRFEAAGRLQTLLEHLVDRTSKRDEEVAYLVRRVTDEFLAGDEILRNAIETGFLEHVLERDDLVDLFAHWQQHPQLSDSYEWALKWGRAHRRAPGGAD